MILPHIFKASGFWRVRWRGASGLVYVNSFGSLAEAYAWAADTLNRARSS